MINSNSLLTRGIDLSTNLTVLCDSCTYRQTTDADGTSALQDLPLLRVRTHCCRLCCYYYRNCNSFTYEYYFLSDFFSYCLCARAPSLGMRMREMAGQRIAAKLGEQLPAWVKEDITALHRYASRLGGVAVHAKVKLAREAGGEGFYHEVAEAVGALLQGETLIFAEYRSEVRALAGLPPVAIWTQSRP